MRILFSNMENTTSISSKKKRLSKGDRLNWTPLRDVQPVRLKECSASSRRLSKVSLSKKRNIFFNSVNFDYSSYICYRIGILFSNKREKY